MKWSRSSMFPRAMGLLLAALFVFGPTGVVSAADTVLIGAKIYPAPDAAPIENGVIIVSDGKISAIGTAAQITIPDGAKKIRADGKVITAGLWNSHVHFNLPPLDRLTGDQISAYVRDMLLQYGFVHVLDTGSLPGVTLELRRRVETGEMEGPTIFIAGGSLVPSGASPFYLRPAVLPDAEAPKRVQAQIDMVRGFGSDGIKIYAGSIISASERGIDVALMDLDVVRGVTTAAHARGMFVVAHPSNNVGAWAAIKGDVDILAHTFPQGGWDRAIPSAMVENDMALIPTLKLWRWEGERLGFPEGVIENSTPLAQEQLAVFSGLGGEVLFGTDVGYMTDFDPTDEYMLMQGAGLSFKQILASLTTAPAKPFGMTERTGRIDVGMDGDLVVLNDDPAMDITAFARPGIVMRRGDIAYQRR